MYVCMCVSMYVCIYVCGVLWLTCVTVCGVLSWMYLNRICVLIFVYVCVYVYVCTRVCPCMHLCICVSHTWSNSIPSLMLHNRPNHILSSQSMASINSTISADTYESECWGIYEENNDVYIYLKFCPTLTEDLNRWKILMKKIETALAVRLVVHGSVNGDYFDLKSFNDECIPLFCNALKNTKVIKSLRVFEALNDIGMKSICQVLQTQSTITSVKFKYNHFKPSIGCDLEDLITVNKIIHSLSVEVRNEDMNFIAKALPHNSTLTFFGIRPTHYYGRVDDKGLRILCEGLKYNQSIAILELKLNDISDEGAKDLCSVLELNHSITDINLSDNQIVNLPEGFAFLTHIKFLYLTANYGLHFPPRDVVQKGQKALFKFFADFRYGPMRFNFLLGFDKRVGQHSSVQLYLNCSSIFEPALLGCIFEFI